MDIPSLPFNRLIGLRPVDPGAGVADARLALPDAPALHNHVGFVHVGALMALAEAAAAECLLRRLGPDDGLFLFVRRFEARFRRPAVGAVSARAEVDDAAVDRLRRELEGNYFGFIAVAVASIDGFGEETMTAEVEWLVSRRPREEE